jgi:hypothetical protein
MLQRMLPHEAVGGSPTKNQLHNCCHGYLFEQSKKLYIKNILKFCFLKNRETFTKITFKL